VSTLLTPTISNLPIAEPLDYRAAPPHGAVGTNTGRHTYGASTCICSTQATDTGRHLWYVCLT